MAPTIIAPDSPSTPELDALRTESGILHDIFEALSNGQIRAREWERAGLLLGYLNDRLVPIEARINELACSRPGRPANPPAES